MCLILFCQKQLTRLQEVLARHSQQQDAQSHNTQVPLSNSDTTPRNTLVQKLGQLVAEKEAKVKELEKEIQQLSLKVCTDKVKILSKTL